MKYTISDENRWTTLAAVVDNQLFYGYAPNVFFDCYRSLDIEPTPYIIKGLYQHQSVNNLVQVKIKPDYKHISPEEWNDITNDFNDLDEQQMQDEIINAMQKQFRNYYFGDVQKQEQEMYFKIKKSLSDMYHDGYTDGYHKKEPEIYDVQGRYDFVLDAVMEYMRAVINNKK